MHINFFLQLSVFYIINFVLILKQVVLWIIIDLQQFYSIAKCQITNIIGIDFVVCKSILTHLYIAEDLGSHHLLALINHVSFLLISLFLSIYFCLCFRFRFRDLHSRHSVNRRYHEQNNQFMIFNFTRV